jgi:hypothetical protein
MESVVDGRVCGQHPISKKNADYTDHHSNRDGPRNLRTRTFKGARGCGMKLLMASPCQTVLIDAELGHSLIAVFHHIAMKVPAEAEIPPNALIPREWAIFSKWQVEPEDTGQNFIQVSQVFWPDGTLLVENRVNAVPRSDRYMAFVVKNQAFPIGQNGEIKIVLWIESEGEKIVPTVELALVLQVTKDLV